MADMIKSEFYLVVRKTGWRKLSARVCSTQPSLKSGEVPIKLALNLPSALFTKPTLRADVTIPESAVTPPTVNAEVLDNVREVIEQQTGMLVQVCVVQPTVEVEP